MPRVTSTKLSVDQLHSEVPPSPPPPSSQLPLLVLVGSFGHESSHFVVAGGDGGGGGGGEWAMSLAPQSAQSVPYEQSE